MVKENLTKVLEDIRKSEKEFNRAEKSVRLLAVSKFHPASDVLEAIKAGQHCFGENRVQEAYDKFFPILKEHPDVELHIIGSLQTNKVKKACEIASVIESVDRMNLLLEIEKQCAKLNKKIQVYFEIHTGEDSKSGFKSIDELVEVLDFIKNGNAPHIEPKGFMTMAPFTDDKELIRSSFMKLKKLKNDMQEKYPCFSFSELSMGMSSDYRIAIQEGSTQVRIGNSIFGERNYSK